jgi:hypothetical protein
VRFWHNNISYIITNTGDRTWDSREEMLKALFMK